MKWDIFIKINGKQQWHLKIEHGVWLSKRIKCHGFWMTGVKWYSNEISKENK